MPLPKQPINLLHQSSLSILTHTQLGGANFHSSVPIIHLDSFSYLYDVIAKREKTKKLVPRPPSSKLFYSVEHLTANDAAFDDNSKFKRSDAHTLVISHYLYEKKQTRGERMDRRRDGWTDRLISDKPTQLLPKRGIDYRAAYYRQIKKMSTA